MVGRDIGTVVVPEAELKLYITASPQERARRRCLDRQRQGHASNYEEILADVIRRDEFDAGRQHSPMRPAADAIEIDTTGKPVDEITEAVVALTVAGLDESKATGQETIEKIGSR